VLIYQPVNHGLVVGETLDDDAVVTHFHQNGRGTRHVPTAVLSGNVFTQHRLGREQKRQCPSSLGFEVCGTLTGHLGADWHSAGST